MEMRPYTSCIDLFQSERGRAKSKSRLKWVSLPNLRGGDALETCGWSPGGKVFAGSVSKSSSKVIPGLLQKTWNKIKSMNKKRANSSSAPPTPNSLQKFDFEDESMGLGAGSGVVGCSGVGEDEDVRMVHENYVKLQRRLSEELHQGQIQQMMKTFKAAGGNGGGGVGVGVSFGGGGGVGSLQGTAGGSSSTNTWERDGGGKVTGECPLGSGGEFKRKLQQWEMWKASCGKVTFTDEELRLILPEDFSRKLKEWESIRSGSPCAVTNAKIEKQIQWLERQLEKVEQEKGKLELQMRKYLEKEARLEKMREALKNYPREQVLIKTPTAEGVAAAGVDEKFTKKLYEWEEMRNIPAEDGSMALLNPKYYRQLAGSSTSSEQPESEDIPETCQDEPEPHTPDTSSSLESINQASGSNTSSADFYQKSRRRSSDAVSTPLSARSPSLSAFTSDDEDNNGLLKTVEEEENEDKPEPPANPIVRVNQIVVEEEEDDDDDEKEKLTGSCAKIIVQTKRTLIQPIECDDTVMENNKYASVIPTAQPSTSSLSFTSSPPIPVPVPMPVQPVKDDEDEAGICSSACSTSSTSGGLRSPALVRSVSLQCSASCTGSKNCSAENLLGSPTKLRAEDIWNKNIDASPPPKRDGPKVVGFIPKLPPLPTTTNSTSSFASSTCGQPLFPASVPTPPPPSFPLSNNYPGSSGCYVQKPVFQHEGLRNFPKMGKTPVWVSPLVARRKMNMKDNKVKEPIPADANEFSIDRFLQNRNLGSVLDGACSRSKYTIGGGFPPQPEGPVRLISLSRSSSFGRGGGGGGDRHENEVCLAIQEGEHWVEEPHHEAASVSLPPVATGSAKVCKSKSASSLLKSSLNIFAKVRRSDTFKVNGTTSSGSEGGQSVKITKTKWFLNKMM